MMENTASPNLVLGLIFGVSFVFGLIGQKTCFCTMGAVADIVNMQDWRRMRMWMLAVGVAILGAASLQAAGLIDLNKSIYRTENFTWLSYIVGGLSFGAGMILASGCGAKTLMRVGGGNLKSLVVFIVLGLVAYMTMRGILGVFRVNVLDQATIQLAGGQDLPALLSRFGVPVQTAFLLSVVVIGGGLTVLSLSQRDFWTAENLLGGVGSGLAVVAAWYISGHIGYLAEHPETLEEAFIATNSGRMEGLTFVAPQAYALELLMLWSDSSRKLSFGIASLLGVVAGAAFWALRTGTFRWQGFVSLEDTGNHLLGAALMGFGGVTAMGCTVGQGLTGVSTLSLGSFLTVLSIIAGAVLMLKFQYGRMMRRP